METLHAEGDSPFVVRDDASIAAVLASEYDENPDEPQYLSCPVEGCGEQLLFAEFDSHLELHAAEQDAGDECNHVSKKLKLEPEIEATFDTKLSHALRNIGGDDGISECSSPERQATAKAAWKGLLKMPETSPKKAVADASRSVRRRLGVSYPMDIPLLSRGFNAPLEVRTWPPCKREADASLACRAPRIRRRYYH